MGDRTGRRLRRRHPGPFTLHAGVIGLALLGALAAAAGALTPYDPLRTGAAPLQAPSRAHPLGTDELGRDLWSNMMYGGRTSLAIGGIAAALASGVGVCAGAAAGYYGSLWDEGLMRVAEVFQIIPQMLIALFLVALFGGRLWTLIPVIASTSWPVTARVVRTEMLALRGREFVTAAVALGGRPAHVVRRHLLPHAFPPVLIGLPMQVGRAILLEAGLAFLGLGDPGVASWGRLLQSAQEYMRQAWWLAVFPGIALTAAVLALYLTAEGLHARLSPRLRSRGPVLPGDCGSAKSGRGAASPAL